jgi:hypothetical protein
MSLEKFSQWLGDTHGSMALHGSVYAYPLVESVHVWALCFFLGMTIAFDLRLVGLTMPKVPVSQMARHLFPWMIAGFVVMVVSGALLYYAIPVRSYHSIFFRAKVVLLFLAGLNAWVFHSTIWRRLADWDVDRITPRRARFAGAASLILWILIVFAGRLIAYNWFDCDKQPQPAALTFLSGCPAGGDSPD